MVQAERLAFGQVPSHGCATQGETFDELLSNIYESVEGCLSAAS
jgi:predicted RNase H-like HicB family nuclease